MPTPMQSLSRARGLTVQQRRAAIMLAAGQSAEQVAEGIGVGVVTVRAWTREADMQREIERIMKPLEADAVAIVERLLPRAERTAECLLDGRLPTPDDGKPCDVPASVLGMLSIGIIKLGVPIRTEISGPDGGPIGLQGVPMADMTDDELEAWAVSRGLRTAIGQGEE